VAIVLVDRAIHAMIDSLVSVNRRSVEMPRLQQADLLFRATPLETSPCTSTGIQPGVSVIRDNLRAWMIADQFGLTSKALPAYLQST
jgi:hypothetical protein